MERTEEDKVTQSGIEVELGGKTYTIRPLVIKYSGEWRKKSIPLITALIRYARLNDTNMEQAITDLFTTTTDEILDSFFSYARDLNRKKIEETATDGEVILAFVEVFSAFVSPLSRLAETKLKTKASLSEPPLKD